MHAASFDSTLPKNAAYAEILAQLRAVFTDEPNGLANAANMSALLYQALPGLNWVGFYFLQDGELILGPFQGKIACVRIALGRGVCGTAAASGQSLIVKDVEAFPGHIACDADSRSEIVVPLIKDGRLLGVLDLDSPNLGRFDEEDRAGLEAAAQLLLQASDLSRLSYP
jgi:L-methionine (R)-S-oxide reductase